MNSLRGRPIELLKTQFKLTGYEYRAVTYPDFFKEHFKITKSLTIQFLSPTYFPVFGSKYRCLFPSPKHLFTNLLRTWNILAKAKFDSASYHKWIEENIHETRHRIQTSAIKVNKKTLVGFLGTCTYALEKEDDFNKLSNLLAHYGELVNVGGNRTGGFGTIKILS